MGSETSKSPSSCSFMATQVGDDLTPRTRSGSSKRLSSPMENRESAKSFTSVEPVESKPAAKFSMPLCLIGDKQTGKTTLLNHLRGKSAAPSYPTHCKINN